MFNRVTIIGLGLIGGSLCLAIKEKRLAKEIVGVSRRKSTIDKAVKNRVADFATLNLKDGVKDSDLVIITTPVFKIVDIAKKIAPFLKKGAIVTDAGSTKKHIVENIEKARLKDMDFVGSHPIAGSEKSGIKHADKDLFKGAYCIVTEAKNKSALNKVKKFWASIGMKVIVMPAQSHDKLLSKISHLPHALAVSLVNTAAGNGLDLAAGGFKDTTRIASGEPELWQDIFLTNRGNLIRDINILKKELSKIEEVLKSNNSRKLLGLLKKAKSIRDSL
ncbi:MAG: prephenate dehydrogenase [Candidatus Omnitrophica bacterium CG22_combo_CG10-13_8_21_14_all_43_16]|nr:MAG: prephenate dehydrogenase [Candidatus Omnitrophica bacterium CG22_combo_CG10-13_8_21_14_all_43_16]